MMMVTKCLTEPPECLRSYRLAHQTLSITGVSFEDKSLVGFVELVIHPLRPDLRAIKLNCKQCCIYCVTINDDVEATFDYADPMLHICQSPSSRHVLADFSKSHSTAAHSVESDHGGGELTVRIPNEIIPLIMEMKPFKIYVEFALEKPRAGIKFVVPDDSDGSKDTLAERGAHLFSLGYENSSRLWFPCIDSFSEVCTWKIELTVDIYMTAVSCGDLVETVYTDDLRKKIYHYYLSTPTAAPNIAIAVGPFEVYVDPTMHEVTHFCLPHLKGLLKHTTAFLHETFELFEELMSSRYPYSCYKQVFVDQTAQEIMPYATMTIASTNLLHSRHIIDQVPTSRLFLAHAVAQQFFSCYISMHSWRDAWLVKGISNYLAGLYRKKAFGNNAYRYWLAEEAAAVKTYEQTENVIILHPEAVTSQHTVFSIHYPQTVSPRYSEMYGRKSQLIMKMLELRIGQELLLQTFNKLLALASAAATSKFGVVWSNMLLSLSSFLKGLSTVTSKDIHPFLEQWVMSGGQPKFSCSFFFNRKRNVVELNLKQDFLAPGSLKYVGPLTVSIQELDGTFQHVFKIEENKTKFEIVCHSKSRRNKKKKIPLCTGEEVDMDLTDMDSDSPVLWLRIDPEMLILREVNIEQPDYMWQYMLRYERDVVGQLEAINALENFSSVATRKTLTDILEDDKCFYQIRTEAAHCLSKVANTMVSTWVGPPAMITIFRKMFGSYHCPEVVRLNSFTNFQFYHLQKVIPNAMAKLRNVHNICPAEVFQFLLDLFKFNNNTKNKYQDNYYQASLITALSLTLMPAATTVTISSGAISTDALSNDTRSILHELTCSLNMEKLLPSYRLTITVACLKAIRRLQRFGHLLSDCSLFKSYASPGNFVDVRLAALECLVDYLRVECDNSTMSYVLDLLEYDEDPLVQLGLIRYLIANPPFTNALVSSHQELADRIWDLINCKLAHDSRLRCYMSDFYQVLFGKASFSKGPYDEEISNPTTAKRMKESFANWNFTEIEPEQVDAPISPQSDSSSLSPRMPNQPMPAESFSFSNLDQNLNLSEDSASDSPDTNGRHRESSTAPNQHNIVQEFLSISEKSNKVRKKKKKQRKRKGRDDNSSPAGLDSSSDFD